MIADAFDPRFFRDFQRGSLRFEEPPVDGGNMR
jgi:hypothetical protein